MLYCKGMNFQCYHGVTYALSCLSTGGTATISMKSSLERNFPLLTGMYQLEIHHEKLFLNGYQVTIRSGVCQMLGPWNE